LLVWTAGVSESEVQNTDEVTAAYASSDEADECVISVSEDLNIVKDVDEDASENESDEYEADEVVDNRTFFACSIFKIQFLNCQLLHDVSQQLTV